MDHPGWFSKLRVCYMFSYMIHVVSMLKNWSRGFLELSLQSLAGKLLHFLGGIGLSYKLILPYQGWSHATSTAQHSTVHLYNTSIRLNSSSLHTMTCWPPRPSRVGHWVSTRVRSKGWVLICHDIFLTGFGGLINEVNEMVSGKQATGGRLRKHSK